MKRQIIILLAVATLALGKISAVIGASQEGAAFLTLPSNARAVGSGQNMTALASDQDFVAGNAAGLAALSDEHKTAGISLSHQAAETSNQLNQFQAGFAHGKTAWGINLLRLSYAPEQGRNADGTLSGRSLNSYDQQLGFAAARSFNGWRLGTQVYAVEENLAGVSARTYAFDAGLQSRTGIHGLSTGLAVLHIGPAIRFVNQKNPLPLIISSALAYRFSMPLSVTAQMDYHPREQRTSLGLGLEMTPASALVLRAGYQNLSSALSGQLRNGAGVNGENISGSSSGLMGGFGLNFSRFSLDYAFQPFSTLGEVQVLTLASHFSTGSMPDEPRQGTNSLSGAEKIDFPSAR